VEMTRPADALPALRALFLHLLPPDLDLAMDRIDVVLHLLDIWFELRTEDGEDREDVEAVASWAQARAGLGFGARRERILGEMAEVAVQGQPDAVPPRLLDQLAWGILVEPTAERFRAANRAALTATWGVREWTTEVDALAGHLLLAHDVDARGRREPGEDEFDLLERLWSVHLPLAGLDVCLGEQIRYELTSE
jgi:hypothetical protein